MRKKCKRVIRPIARPLTPKEKVDFLIGPRLHLQMLLSQQYALHYTCSVAGFFNFSEVLAFLLRRPDLQPHFASAQEIVLQLIAQERPPLASEGVVLCEIFNLADRFIAMQDTLTMARAMRHANRKLDEGVGAPRTFACL